MIINSAVKSSKTNFLLLNTLVRLESRGQVYKLNLNLLDDFIQIEEVIAEDLHSGCFTLVWIREHIFVYLYF